MDTSAAVADRDISLDDVHHADLDAGAAGLVWALVPASELHGLRVVEVRSEFGTPVGQHRPAPSSEHELPIFLAVPDVAALLRTTAKAVYSKVERGLLPGVIRDGTRLLFDRDVLLRELRRRR